MQERKTVHYNAERLYKLIKDNLSLLIILPTLVGGLWQVIELSSLSISFLRFFSVSQLVADGLLILIVFSFFIFSILLLPIYAYWVFPPSDKLKETIEKTEKDSTKKEIETSFVDKRPLISFIIFYGFIYLLIYGMVKYSVTSIKELLIFTIVGLIGIYILRNIYLKERRTVIKYKKMVFLCSMLMFAIIFTFVAMFCRHMHNLFLLPKDLINVEKIKTSIGTQYPKDTIDILYANDKYIFFEVKNQKSKILIVPFEDLVKNKQ